MSHGCIAVVENSYMLPKAGFECSAQLQVRGFVLVVGVQWPPLPLLEAGPGCLAQLQVRAVVLVVGMQRPPSLLAALAVPVLIAHFEPYDLGRQWVISICVFSAFLQ